MELRPTNSSCAARDRLYIEWSDGQKREITVSASCEQGCPCATCREKRAQPPAPSTADCTVLSLAEARPLAILGMKPVGNYAYSIAFSDGHDTGIFTLEFLRELGEEVPA